ncbi:DUF4179 domain-containing protein [Saccharibacillus sacchari]|uniref:DUF4179 domain-containing protein n=1 Tax=Saccharibacillus sacchari TaxID=456493 RepID=UPI0004B71B8E|nr:DUF4179 domain-containing protein [Saccharibacillus sacchari]
MNFRSQSTTAKVLHDKRSSEGNGSGQVGGENSNEHFSDKQHPYANEDARKNDEYTAREDAQWTSLFSQEKLPDDFTERFMAELEGVDMDSVPEVPVEQADNDKQDPEAPTTLEDPGSSPERKVPKKRKSRKPLWITAAVIVFLAGGILLSTHPTIAEHVRSLFSKDSMADKGMSEARDAGFLTSTNVFATDEASGYTVKVEELIADSTRLVVGLTVSDKHGNSVAGQLTQGQGNQFRIRDSQGEVAYTSSIGGNSSLDQIEFRFGRPAVGQSLSLEIDARELLISPGEALSDSKRQKVGGLWTLNVDIDLTKAADVSIITRLNESYETPAGVKINMLGATRTPSGGALEFETSLTPEAQKRGTEGIQSKHEVLYRIERTDGEELPWNYGSYDFASPVFDRWTGINRWFYRFSNFSYTTEPLRFVLEGYMIREKSDASVSFDPSSLSAQNPAVFKDSGDEFELTGMTVGPDPNREGSGAADIPSAGIITFGGSYSNPGFPTDDWIALDDAGNEYRVQFRGALTIGDPKLEGSQTFIVEGLETMPSKLTLKRTEVQHLYRDGEWSFEIPQTGTPGVVPE